VSYGFTYFKKYTIIGLVLIYGSQFLFCIKWSIPLVQRNQQEQIMAAQISKYVAPYQILYGFDWDIAMQTYLPNLQQRNLWVTKFDSFEVGAFVIFNAPALEKQWVGKNPMLNWEALNRDYRLEEVVSLPKGWFLYIIKEKK
jgi:hypothetical protein